MVTEKFIARKIQQFISSDLQSHTQAASVTSKININKTEVTESISHTKLTGTLPPTSSTLIPSNITTASYYRINMMHFWFKKKIQRFLKCLYLKVVLMMQLIIKFSFRKLNRFHCCLLLEIKEEYGYMIHSLFI